MDFRYKNARIEHKPILLKGQMQLRLITTLKMDVSLDLREEVQEMLPYLTLDPCENHLFGLHEILAVVLNFRGLLVSFQRFVS